MSTAIDAALGACEAGATSERFGRMRRAVYAQAAGSLRLVKAAEDADERQPRPKESGLAGYDSQAA